MLEMIIEALLLPLRSIGRIEVIMSIPQHCIRSHLLSNYLLENGIKNWMRQLKLFNSTWRWNVIITSRL